MKLTPSRFSSLGDAFSSPVEIRRLKKPEIEVYNNQLISRMKVLGSKLHREDFLYLLKQENNNEHGSAIAMAYAGHQYGNFNPFLGDGRSAVVGTVSTASGDMEISLKGIGPTPYAYRSDGRAGISECLKEYDISVALIKRGIPSVESVCVIKGKDRVKRNVFEPEAVLIRAARCFIRFGTFELVFFRKSKSDLQKLCEFVIGSYFPEISLESRANERYFMLLREIVFVTAKLIASWDKNGFVHGMMNTDNMSILGISLDLGDSYFVGQEPKKILDEGRGRYDQKNQACIGLWNCNILAKTFSPLLPESRIREALMIYEATYISEME